MARQPQAEFRETLYHVMSRGNRGEVAFREDGGRKLWLETMTGRRLVKMRKKLEKLTL